MKVVGICMADESYIGVARNLSWGHSAGFVKFFLGAELRRQMRRWGGMWGVPSPWGGVWKGTVPLPIIFFSF